MACLALRADGTVRAWGWNNKGQLGDGSATQQELPIQVPMLSGMVAIAAGGEHSLALHHSGMVRAWGANGFGQIGNDTASASQPNPRSEERRVGKECRSRWSPYH